MRTVNARVLMLVSVLVIANEIGSSNSIVIGYLGTYFINRTEMASLFMAIEDAKASGVLPNSTQIV